MSWKCPSSSPTSEGRQRCAGRRPRSLACSRTPRSLRPCPAPLTTLKSRVALRSSRFASRRLLLLAGWRFLLSYRSVMRSDQRGVVAAGHPLTAQAGARVLREGGNAVDATVAAMLTSFVSEALLTGLGAGGYMMVAGAGVEPTLLDFFAQAPTRLGDGTRGRSLRARGQLRGCRAGVPYRPGLLCGLWDAGRGREAVRRWGTLALEQLAASRGAAGP